jgi:hypothetical protein
MTPALAIALATALISSPTQAREVWVEITNQTNAQYFTPLLVAAHDSDLRLFEIGTEASAALQAMAEGGVLTGLIDQVAAAGANFVADPAGGLLGPGQSTVAVLDVNRRYASHLSITAMLLPTNDGFVGLSALPIPLRPGRYVYDLKGHDAGTEANDELITGGGAPGVPGIPADPGGNAGTGGTGAAGPDHNPLVHVHRGILGDLDPDGGVSDLDSSVHRWDGPVARMVLTVKHRARRHRDDDHADRDRGRDD